MYRTVLTFGAVRPPQGCHVWRQQLLLCCRLNGFMASAHIMHDACASTVYRSMKQYTRYAVYERYPRYHKCSVHFMCVRHDEFITWNSWQAARQQPVPMNGTCVDSQRPERIGSGYGAYPLHLYQCLSQTPCTLMVLDRGGAYIATMPLRRWCLALTPSTHGYQPMVRQSAITTMSGSVRHQLRLRALP
uniref:Uncharacterized protein n=1 Tax=Phytophthora infestans TaxID=4787 RepID=Q572F6_PHYIN|nr:hypothetical protein PI49.0280c [Phytophthora infestans]